MALHHLKKDQISIYAQYPRVKAAVMILRFSRAPN